jgi:hypothetical protein
VVTAIKGTEKRNLQAAKGIAFKEAGMPLDLFPGPGFGIEAPVLNPYIIILSSRVGGADIAQIALK